MKKLICIALSCILALGLAACGAPAAESSAAAAPASPTEAPSEAPAEAPSEAPAGETALRFMWWGNDARHEITLEVIDMYEQANPGVKFSTEYMPNDSYHEKLATMVAGNAAPDIMQQGGGYPDYVAKNALLELDSYVGNVLDLSSFDQDVLEIGSMNGNLFGICLGTNMPCLLYNKTMLEEAGAPLPGDDMTWDDLRAYLEQIAPLLPEGTYPMTDNGNNQTNYMTYYMRQKGRPIWHDNTVSMTAADAQEWVELWQGYREASLVPDIETSATYFEDGPDSSALIARKTAIALYWSNQVAGYQAATEDTLDLMQMPLGESSGNWVQPSQYLCVSKNSAVPEEAVKFVSFFVNDVEAGKILGNDRGISSSSVVREAMMEIANEVDQNIYDYYAIATQRTIPMDPNLPNDREFIDSLNLIVQTYAYGEIDSVACGEQVYDLVMTLKDK